ncbi:sigma-70 family RNA polymerase sigma factor [Kitasatospora sp. NPDC097691]|uniref:sigma-70 family RNA polymerase sigma factor n=1 Tax=Kitasatospora sp. NPDC097691 TaxID=3157231 RepID=UPI00332E8861
MRCCDPTDAELGALARAGDGQALAVLLERWRPSLYATAIGLLGSRADALDALQDTYLAALAHVGELREPAAAGAWLRAVLRSTCLMRIRQRREVPYERVEQVERVGRLGRGEPADPVPGPEEALDRTMTREWVWHALGGLSEEERVTVVLRHFSRCTGYDAIARVTQVPVGTVRSRLNRARSRLAEALRASAEGAPTDHARMEAVRHRQWHEFYTALHERPVPRTYRDLFAADVEVRDAVGRWSGIERWSAHEREAIARGVRARIVGVLAARDLTVVEVDFTNPASAPGHCPAQATFVHTLVDGRSTTLRIHYPQARSSDRILKVR